VFDWDDTLFPTAAFRIRSEDDLRAIKKKEARYFTKLDGMVAKLLTMSLTSKDSLTVVVTNAAKFWVDISSQFLMPETAKMLQTSVKVVSARIDGVHPSEWKTRTFKRLFAMFELSEDLVTNLMVVGDSMHEINAGQELAKELPHCILKIIKMSEKPTSRELRQQLEVIMSSWERVRTVGRDFSMKLAHKERRTPSETSSDRHARYRK
jgi:ribosomal protein S10